MILGLALLTLRVLENRVGILTGDGYGGGLSMLKLLEMLSSGFDGVGVGKNWTVVRKTGGQLVSSCCHQAKHKSGPAQQCPWQLSMS